MFQVAVEAAVSSAEPLSVQPLYPEAVPVYQRAGAPTMALAVAVAAATAAVTPAATVPDSGTAPAASPLAGGLRVDSVVESEGRRSRPAAMNTVEMLKAASRSLGIGPHAAMAAAERLYLQGYISYPRTESSAYPPSFDLLAAVEMQTRHSVSGWLPAQTIDQRLANIDRAWYRAVVEAMASHTSHKCVCAHVFASDAAKC